MTFNFADFYDPIKDFLLNHIHEVGVIALAMLHLAWQWKQAFALKRFLTKVGKEFGERRDRTLDPRDLLEFVEWRLGQCSAIQQLEQARNVAPVLGFGATVVILMMATRDMGGADRISDVQSHLAKMGPRVFAGLMTGVALMVVNTFTLLWANSQLDAYRVEVAKYLPVGPTAQALKDQQIQLNESVKSFSDQLNQERARLAAHAQEQTLRLDAIIKQYEQCAGKVGEVATAFNDGAVRMKSGSTALGHAEAELIKAASNTKAQTETMGKVRQEAEALSQALSAATRSAQRFVHGGAPQTPSSTEATPTEVNGPGYWSQFVRHLKRPFNRMES